MYWNPFYVIIFVIMASTLGYIDQLLLRQLRAGDEQALGHLYQSHYNRLYRLGLRWTGEGEMVEEAIQEVFQSLWQYRETLGEIESFEAYLTTSLKRQIYRKKPGPALETLTESVMTVPSYEDLLVRHETDEHRRELLKKALESLTDRQKEIIVLKYFEELTYKEITERTGLQIESVYKTLHEGLKRLRTYLDATSTR